MDKGHDQEVPVIPTVDDEKLATQSSPVGITLLVVDGPYDGIVYSTTDTKITFGREVDGPFELPLDAQISRKHCEVRFDTHSGDWILEDFNSSNGTWYSGNRISTPQVLQPDTEFVIGTTVIRCHPGSEDPSFLPKPSAIEKTLRDLIGRLDMTAAQSFGAARMLALQEKSSVLTDRHLFLGLVSTNGEISFISHGNGLLKTRFLVDRVGANDYWTGAKKWIEQLVRIGSNENADGLFADQLTTTPRVIRALTVAANQSENFGYDLITSNTIFFGLLDDANGRLKEFYEAEGGDLKILMAQLTRPTTKVVQSARPGSMNRRIPTDSSVLPRPAPIPKVIDPAIVDLAASTLYAASKYHLASATDRRKALKETITAAIAGISEKHRQESLEQLRECFPVTHCDPVSTISSGAQTKVIALEQRVEELESALSRANGVSVATTTPIPWSDIFNSEREFRSDLFGREDADALKVVHNLVGFGLAIENFVIQIVAGLSQTSMTGLMSLPGFATTIRRTINVCASGQPVPDGFTLYLNAVETWLVATIAAYHKAPEDWFTNFWNKTSPTRIEAKVPAKILSDAKCWVHYKNVVRRISPDLVADEILVMVRENAQSQYDELIKRRSS